MDAEGLLRVYDVELRTDAETPGAVDVRRHGPLRLVTFAGGRGFVTYADLVGAGPLDELVGEALEVLTADGTITRIEWKTRGHDHAPGLHEALLVHGFVPDETEAVMMGETAALAHAGEPPPGVTLRRVHAEADVRAACEHAGVVFDDPPDSGYADAILARLARDDGTEMWVAEADGQIVSSGRLEPVAGSQVAGIWGGGTSVEWRGRGVYRALVAARARSALRTGRTILHSDSTPMSEPILARAGLMKVSTTTPYEWRRP